MRRINDNAEIDFSTKEAGYEPSAVNALGAKP